MAARASRVRRLIVVLRSPPISFPDLKHVGAFFSKLKFREILLFLNRNKNSENSPKRMHPRKKKPEKFS